MSRLYTPDSNRFVVTYNLTEGERLHEIHDVVLYNFGDVQTITSEQVVEAIWLIGLTYGNANINIIHIEHIIGKSPIQQPGRTIVYAQLEATLARGTTKS